MRGANNASNTWKCQVELQKNELLTFYAPDPIPAMYNPDQLPKIDRYRMVWFDEMHIK